MQVDARPVLPHSFWYNGRILMKPVPMERVQWSDFDETGGDGKGTMVMILVTMMP